MKLFHDFRSVWLKCCHSVKMTSKNDVVVAGSYFRKRTPQPPPELTCPGAAITDKLRERCVKVAPIAKRSVFGCQYPDENVFNVPASTSQTTRYQWIQCIVISNRPLLFVSVLNILHQNRTSLILDDTRRSIPRKEERCERGAFGWRP